jgi:hypothetical protein
MVRGQEAHIVDLCPTALLSAQQAGVATESKLETLQSERHFESEEAMTANIEL